MLTTRRKQRRRILNPTNEKNKHITAISLRGTYLLRGPAKRIQRTRNRAPDSSVAWTPSETARRHRRGHHRKSSHCLESRPRRPTAQSFSSTKCSATTSGSNRRPATYPAKMKLTKNCGKPHTSPMNSNPDNPKRIPNTKPSMPRRDNDSMRESAERHSAKPMPAPKPVKPAKPMKRKPKN